MSQTINIRVVPRSAKNEIIGEMADGTLKVKLKAPPVDGKANAALIEFLSKEWGVSKTKIQIIRGLASRNKIIMVK